MKLVRTHPISPPGFFGLAPLVNIVLLLLLFFLLGSSFVLQPGVAVSLPASRFQLAPLVDAQVVSVLPGKPTRVVFGDQFVSLEEFGVRLAAFRGPNRSLIVRGDRGTPYEAIVAICGQALEQGFSVVLATAPDSSGGVPATVPPAQP